MTQQPALFKQDPLHEHPAIALHRFWSLVLDTLQRESAPFGHRDWAISRDASTGCINLGRDYGWTNSSRWSLMPDGRFQWGHRMHGAHQRGIVAQTVPFLRWGHTHSRYQWFFSTDPAINNGSWTTHWTSVLTNPDSSLHYVSEDLLGCRLYHQTPVWCELTMKDGEWRISPARYQVTNSRQIHEDRLHEWAHYEKIIERRRITRARRDREGMGLSPLSVRTPTIHNEGKSVTVDQAVTRLVALLEPQAPAKTTPLKRPKEAAHGNHDVAPANIV